MAQSQNPYSLRVELNVEKRSVDVNVREKVNGEFQTSDSESFPLSAVSPDILDQVTLYGLSKLLQDRSSDVKAGPEKLTAMQEVLSQLAAGQWERERKAGAPTVSAEVEALAAIKGVSVADIQTALRKFSKEQKETILGNEAVKAKAAEIRASREATDVNLDDLI